MRRHSRPGRHGNLRHAELIAPRAAKSAVDGRRGSDTVVTIMQHWRVFDVLLAQPEPWPISPARLLKAQLLIALYGIDPDAFCQALRAEPSFPWFLDMPPTEEVDWSDPTRQRECLADRIVARWFFSAVLASARSDGTLDAAEFAVDSELLGALGSLERVRHRGDGPTH